MLTQESRTDRGGRRWQRQLSPRTPRSVPLIDGQLHLWRDCRTAIQAPPPEACAPSKARKSGNIEHCNACGDDVALLHRKGVKLAWTEATVVIRNSKRILYWCEPCTESREIQVDQLRTGQRVR